MQRGAAGDGDGRGVPHRGAAGGGHRPAGAVPLLLWLRPETGGRGQAAGGFGAPDPAPAPAGSVWGPGVQGDQGGRAADLGEGHRRGAESEGGALRPGGRTLPLERQGRPAAAVQRGQVPAGGHGPARGRGGGGWALRRLPRRGAGQRAGRQPARFGAGAAVPGAAAPGHRGAQGLGPAAGAGAGGPAPSRGVGRAPGAGALAADGRGAAGGAPKPGGAAVWLAGRL